MDSDSSILSDLSSDLSSIRSLSPPVDYPSPTLTQDTENGDSCSSQSKKRSSDTEEQPPTKKRKRPELKPRKTDTLDLTKDLSSVAIEQKDGLHKLLQVLRKRRKIVVIAGAGISVSAGIPDFRSSTGLFKTLKSEHKLKASGKQLFDASVYQTDSSTSTFHNMVRQLSEQANNSHPTPFHEMLSTLGLEDRLLRLYTQNVDGLDVKLPFLETEVPLNSKGPWPRTIQVHGGLENMACSKCNGIFKFEPELFDGPDPPLCSKCVEADRIRTDQAGKRSHGVGRLRPRMALYNERTPDEDAIGAVMAADLRARPDALIVVGTSLKIPGVKRLVREMCGVIRDRRDGLTIWMNMDPPPLGKEFEDCWDLVVKGPCDEVADQWKDSHLKDQSGSDTEKENLLKATKKAAKILRPLPTPSASPPDSDEERKPSIKIHITKDKITSSKCIDGKDIKPKVARAKKPKLPKLPRLRKKPVVGESLTSKFKIAKPGITATTSTSSTTKAKLLVPKKLAISTLLSSPQLAPYKPQPQPQLQPAKIPTKASLKLPPIFPGPSKYSLEKVNKSFTHHRNVYLPPLNLSSGDRKHFESSPPSCEPLSSSVREKTDRSKFTSTPSRPGSSGSSGSQETVSPTSVPRGMRSLID